MSYTLIDLPIIFYLIGGLFWLIALLSWRDKSNPKSMTTGLFWFLLGIGFLLGDVMLTYLGKSLTHQILGAIVFVLALLAGLNLLGAGQNNAQQQQVQLAFKHQQAQRLQNRLFLPAIAIPVLTVAFSLSGSFLHWDQLYLLDPKNLTLSSLALACALSLAYACRTTTSHPWQAIKCARSLVDALGWALCLPLMLAMLGGVFVAAKTGDAIQQLVVLAMDPNNRTALIIVYCVGMALMTMIMGNAFAAFPIMSAGIALPFLIQQHHANPAPLVALGMLSGYCGTLMTPMAANFNIVPAALLELKDKYQLIRTQIPTALAVLCCNIILMIFLV